MTTRIVNIKKVTETHLETFDYWMKLGPTRTYQKVANKFNLNKETIVRYAKFFEWKKRLDESMNQDNVLFIGELSATVDAIRKGAIKLTDKLNEWSLEAMVIQDIAIREKREMTEKEKGQLGRLHFAIRFFDTKSLRDRHVYFSENVHFDETEKKERPKQIPEGGGVQVTGPTLIIMGLDKDKEEKKAITLVGKEEEKEHEEKPYKSIVTIYHDETKDAKPL